MPSLTLQNLDDDLRDRLRDLADSHGRTIEEEASEILRGAVHAQNPAEASDAGGKLGSRIAARFAAAGLEQDIPELRGHTRNLLRA